MAVFTTLLLITCFISISLSAPVYQTIGYGELVASLKGPAPYELVLEWPNVNDPYQQWEFVDGYIVNRAQPTYVFDIFDEKTSAGAFVGAWLKKPSNAPILTNQLWNLVGGAFESEHGVDYYLKPIIDEEDRTGYLVADYTQPPIPAIRRAPVINPMMCSSVGDPHIVPFDPNGGYNPLLNSPGGQLPGDFLLAGFGDVRVWEKQQICNAAALRYCNYETAIEVNGQKVVIAGDVVKVNNVVQTFTGTLNLGNGVSVTRNSARDFRVNVPGGYVTVNSPNAANLYQNVQVVIESGPQPDSGLCTKYVGPVMPSPITYVDFWKSWQARTPVESPFYYATQVDFNAANPTTYTTSGQNLTTTNTALRNLAINLCAPLHPSGSLATQCNSALEIASHYQACLDDVIGGEDGAFAADTIDAYASRCAHESAPAAIILPTSGAKSIAYGPGLAATVSALLPTSFTISARDANRKNRTTGGDVFSVSSTPPLLFTVVDNNNGRYTVSYIPLEAAMTISVKFRNTDHVADSPFTVTGQSSVTSPIHSIAFGPGLAATISAGPRYSFTIQARTAGQVNRTSGGDIVTVILTGLPFDISVVDHRNGTYTAFYEQYQFGTFTVVVMINGLPISGSPFFVTAN